MDDLEQAARLARLQMEAHFGEVSQCDSCRHLRSGGARCNAFPDGIPSAILVNNHDHHKPFPGDHGILYSPR